MRKSIIFILALLWVIASGFATDTLYNITLNSSSTNASLTFDVAVNVSEIYLDEDQVTLLDFIFNETTDTFYYDSSLTNNISNLTFTESNTNVKSSDFIHTFSFYDTRNNLNITNYTFGDYFSSGQFLNIFFTEFGIDGNKTWTFDKFAYPLLNFTFSFLFSSHNDVTFNISPSEINIFIYDVETGNLINGTNVTIDLVGTGGTTKTTTNGTVQYVGNGLGGSYSLTASASGYDNENYYFSFTNQEVKNVSIYMINSTNSEQFTFKVTGPFSDNIQGATVKALKWNGATSQYELVMMDKTDSSGLATLNLVPGTTHYTITAELGSRFASLESKTYTVEDATDVIPITLPLETENINYNQIEIRNIVANITSGYSAVSPNTTAYFTLTYNDPDETATKHCIKIYTYRGTYLNQLAFNEATDCSSNPTGSIVATFTYQNGTNYIAKYYATVNEKEYFVTYGTFDTEPNLAINGIIALIVIVFSMFTIYLGYAGKFMEMSIAGFTLALWLVHWSGWFLSGTYGFELMTGFTVMAIVGIWGVNKLK